MFFAPVLAHCPSQSSSHRPVSSGVLLPNYATCGMWRACNRRCSSTKQQSVQLCWCAAACVTMYVSTQVPGQHPKPQGFRIPNWPFQPKLVTTTAEQSHCQTPGSAQHSTACLPTCLRCRLRCVLILTYLPHMRWVMYAYTACVLAVHDTECDAGLHSLCMCDSVSDSVSTGRLPPTIHERPPKPTKPTKRLSQPASTHTCRPTGQPNCRCVPCIWHRQGPKRKKPMPAQGTQQGLYSCLYSRQACMWCVQVCCGTSTVSAPNTGPSFSGVQLS